MTDPHSGHCLDRMCLYSHDDDAGPGAGPLVYTVRSLSLDPHLCSWNHTHLTYSYLLPLTVVFILCSRSLTAVALSRSYRISIYLPCPPCSPSLTLSLFVLRPVPAGMSSHLTMSPDLAHPIRPHYGTSNHSLSRSNDTIPSLDRSRSGRSGRVCTHMAAPRLQPLSSFVPFTQHRASRLTLLLAPPELLPRAGQAASQQAARLVRPSSMAVQWADFGTSGRAPDWLARDHGTSEPNPSSSNMTRGCSDCL